MANFNIGQQNAASIQNIGGDAVIEGGIHAYATWEVVELRRVIARAQEGAAALELPPSTLEAVSQELDAAAREAAQPKPDKHDVAEHLGKATRTLQEAGALVGAGTRSSKRSTAQPGSLAPWARPSSTPSRPIDSTRGRLAPHRELSLWRGSLRSDRASDLGKLLPLHALSETNRHRRLGTGSNRPRIASNHGRRGARPRLRARGSIPKGILLRLRLGALEHSPGH